jgi:NAD(P)-dependent dehydrogenase (short-subunit alcohol dehydrogenase family)
MSEPFGAASTTDQVLEGVDLRGKRILVTGASAGLGVETCRALVAHGATVVGAVRDLAKARQATQLVADAGARSGGSFELVQVDLASLASVRICTEALLGTNRKLDGIIANAGVMACPQGLTADGFEIQFGTNHLGHFLLINRLVPLLATGARIVNLSSSGHRFADVDLDDPGFERTPYDPFVAYGRSKTANILFTVALDRRLRSRGIRASAVHPGVIQTELGRHMTPAMIERITAGATAGAAMTWKTIPQGAATSVWSGFRASADAVGGRYCEDCHVAEVTDDPSVRAGVRAYAIDPARADALWALSERLVQESFAPASG